MLVFYSYLNPLRPKDFFSYSVFFMTCDELGSNIYINVSWYLNGQAYADVGGSMALGRSSADWLHESEHQ